MRTGLLILNIISFIFSIPAAFCSYLCAGAAAGLSAYADGKSADSTIEGLAGATWLVWLFCLVAFIFGFLAYAKPKSARAIIAGILLIIAGIAMISLIMTGNVLGVITGILYIIAGGLAFGAKPDSAKQVNS